MLVVVFVDVELVVVNVVIEFNRVVVTLVNAAELVTVSPFNVLLAIAAVVEFEASVRSTTVALVESKELFCLGIFVGIPPPSAIWPVALTTFYSSIIYRV
jgi:hypothetical protein